MAVANSIVSAVFAIFLYRFVCRSLVRRAFNGKQDKTAERAFRLAARLLR